MRYQAGPTREQRDDNIECGIGMAKHADREQCSAHRPDDRVDRVPRRIDPGNLVGEKFEEIEDTRDRDDDRISQHFERLVLRRECDPMLVHGETGYENGQVKIDPRQRGEAKGNPEKVELFHGGNMKRPLQLSRGLIVVPGGEQRVAFARYR